MEILKTFEKKYAPEKERSNESVNVSHIKLSTIN